MLNIDKTEKWTKIWRTTLLTLGILLSIANKQTIYVVSAEGNIGCLYEPSLCLDHIEWCYDDFAFGLCLPQYGLDPEDLMREHLDEDQLGILLPMMEDFQGAGLGWDHPFVQCRMKIVLRALRARTPLPQSFCADLAPDPEVLAPQSPLAFVRFTPIDDDYAEEYYVPANYKRSNLQYSIQPIKKSTSNPEILPDYFPLKQHHAPTLEDLQQHHLQKQIIKELENEHIVKQRMKDIKNRIENRRMLEELEVAAEKAAHQRMEDYTDDQAMDYEMDRLYSKTDDKRTFFREQQERLNEEALEEMLDHLTKHESIQEPIVKPKTSSFREYAIQHHIPKVSNFAPENVNNMADNEIEDENLLLKKLKSASKHHGNMLPENFREEAQFSPSENGVYTEGGYVYVPKVSPKSDARDLLNNILGFTRHERLDVKKPGPPAAPPSLKSPPEGPVADPNTKELVPETIPKGSQKTKKELTPHNDEDHAPHSVDTEYAHVILKNPIDNWKDGSRIVAALAELLNMQDYFTHPRVDRHEVSFRVAPNPEKKTASDVAKAINDSRFKNNLSRRLGVTVVQAGVGDKTKQMDPVTSERLKRGEGTNVTHLMAYMFAGAGVAAVVVIVITLFLIKRHDKKKDKLGGLQTGISGNDSKDYQDLCRARMAGKNDSPSGRITALTKESERPPSSRSSTSSWSEEPALTNMDISTGHMVLSYMEDHLRNKGRLQREWEGLCKYEAEPSAREAAMQSQCAPLNRPGAPLPFDHSRVVLNHLANAEGMDYINASTITDHDPRAPAYVAAQGPLQTSLAHFWQMVWEQGAVVLVSLCRLQENGETACTRYWPEEGAEVYHIYEVHLVSEHIWCDDYLVRSFYLKNLRTGETRTVTQFHFLSWPQGGVPTSAKALLDFRRKVNKSYRGRSCPIVVHSSNGSGRTGAYILLDLVLGRMNKGAREIDIAATLEHLRDQRAGLVATRQQFEFVLMAVAEEVHAILKALPQNSQTEKKELDNKETKEQSGENEKLVEKTTEK